MTVPQTTGARLRVAVIGPMYPYRGAISLCTVNLAAELEKRFDVDRVSFRRQYPLWLYPGESDVDPTISQGRTDARFSLDVLNPLSWFAEGLRLRRSRPDAVVFAWWVWVWALPYLVIISLLRRSTRIVLQCHNISDKEPAWWKTALANAVFRRGDVVVVHSKSGATELGERLAPTVLSRTLPLFLPLLPIGGAIPSREEAREAIGIGARKVVLFFGHIRPFKGLDVALEAWQQVASDVLLIVAGEVWFEQPAALRERAQALGVDGRVRFELRYIPDAEVASWFAAADVVLAPYRHEAQSGVAMNAFHFGRAVIASAVGGIPDVVEHERNGLLVPPADPTALAAAVNRFFDLEMRDRLEAGVRESRSRFSWERYGSAIADAISGGHGTPDPAGGTGRLQ